MDALGTDRTEPDVLLPDAAKQGGFAQRRGWFAIVDSSPSLRARMEQKKMAQITQVKLVDDLDGGEAAESVAFSLDGKTYEIDLSEKHAAALRDAFAPFIGGARRAGNAAKVGSQQRMSTVRSTGPDRARGETAAIREWANVNGLEVSTRGRISSTVLEAYQNRATVPAAAPVTEAAAGSAVEVAVEAQPKPKRRNRKKADAEA
jgi:Lsr2